MKKIICVILVLMAISLSGMAQPKRDSMPRANVMQGLKMAFIHKRLNLTKEESQKFWPVYFNYMDDLKKARQEKKDDIIGQEENVLAVRKKYKEEFKKVLNSDERVNKMLTVDRDFNNTVQRELQQRRQFKNNQFRNNPRPPLTPPARN